jgi:hypothetical protein
MTMTTTKPAVSASKKTKASFDDIKNIISAMRMRSQEAAVALLSTRSLTIAALLELTDNASTPPPKSVNHRPSIEPPEEAEESVLAVELHPAPCGAAVAYSQAISPLTERSTPPLPAPALAAYEEQPNQGLVVFSSAPWRSALGDRSYFAAAPSTKIFSSQQIPTNRRTPASATDSEVICTAPSFQDWRKLEGMQGQASVSRLHHRNSLEEGPSHEFKLQPFAPTRHTVAPLHELLQHPEWPHASTAYSGSVYNPSHQISSQRQERQYHDSHSIYQSISSLRIPPGAEATWSKYRNLSS